MNLSILPREVLVNELLGASRTAAEPESQLTHVLGVAKELLLRGLHRDMQTASIIASPAALRDWLRLYCADLQHEVFFVVFLDVHHRVLDVEPMFRGTITQTSVYPREVVKAALARNAAAVALAHNHPSGQAEPSRADEMLTATLKSALALVDVRIIDHFVVSGDQLVSFAERGLL